MLDEACNPRDYKACYAAVMAGRKVTLAVAAYATTDFYCELIPGKERGVYDCWLQTEGLDHPIPYFQLKNPPRMDAMPTPTCNLAMAAASSE